MHNQYLCNRQISVQYAYKKDTRGERHGGQVRPACLRVVRCLLLPRLLVMLLVLPLCGLRQEATPAVPWDQSEPRGRPT